MTKTAVAAALVSVLALRTIKYDGKRRVPGTESATFDVPPDVAQDLVADGSVRLVDPDEIPASDDAPVEDLAALQERILGLTHALSETKAELADVTGQLNQAAGALDKVQGELDQAVIERDQARAEVPVLRQQFEQAQADLARVEGELAAATKPAADAAGQEGGDAAAPAKTAKGAK